MNRNERSIVNEGRVYPCAHCHRPALTTLGDTVTAKRKHSSAVHITRLKIVVLFADWIADTNNSTVLEALAFAIRERLAALASDTEPSGQKGTVQNLGARG
jgi:hypothetical protein